MSNPAQKLESKDSSTMQQAGGLVVFSEELPNISADLNLLYIRSNSSGRNKFRSKWPKVAEYIFGEQLIAYDNDGIQDHDLRIELEAEAGEIRISLKQTIAELKEKSIDDGSLQTDYVESVIDLYGPYIASLLYLDNIIERVRAGSLEKIKSAREDVSEKRKEASESLETKETPAASDNTPKKSPDSQPDNKFQETPKPPEELSKAGVDTPPAIEPIKTDTPVISEELKEDATASIFSKKDDDTASKLGKDPAASAPSIFGQKKKIKPAQDAVEKPPEEIKSGIYTILFNTASSPSA